MSVTELHRNPIAVSLEDDGTQMIASAYDLDLLGYGETERDAVDDLRRTIVDLYLTLRENVNALSPLPQQVWEYLADVVEEEPFPEGIALIEAERIAREREPGDGTVQKTVVEQIEEALG